MKKKRTKNSILLLFRKIRLAIIKIYRAKGSPSEIALGAAIGAFWGVFPTFGLSTPLIFILYRFIRFNIITAFAGALVSNPLTSPFLLFFSYKIGSLFITPPKNIRIEDWAKHLNEFGIIMLVGSIVLSTVVAIAVYFIVIYFVNREKTQTKTY